MKSEDVVGEIVARWREAADGGAAETPEEVIARHPEHADELRRRFAALARLGAAGSAVWNLLATPDRIGGYRIVREIGRGGMGVVYEAEQEALKRRVALKVLSPSVTSTARAVERFRREAHAAGTIKHTNIVAVHDLGSDGGFWYCAMELVEGRPLSDVIAELRASRKPPRESRLARRALEAATDDTDSNWTGSRTGTRAYYVRIAEMFAEVADALQAAHDKGVIHRDIKPANLLLDHEGKLRIVDFGLARLDEDENAMTRTGDLVGTPLYMSPEQLGLGGGKVDGRTDVYSLGATLYEAIAGVPPVRGRNLHQIASRIKTSDPSAMRRWDRRVPRELDAIVGKALEKNPGARYATAGDLARDLRLFSAGEAIRAQRIGAWRRLLRRARRHPALSAAMIALVAVAGVAVHLGIGASREEALRRALQYRSLCAEAAELATSTRESDRAAELYGEAITIDGSRPDAYVGRALLGGTGAMADMEAAAERGVPERAVALYRAYLLRRQGEPARADREEQRAARLPGGDPMSLFVEGVLALHRGDYQHAEGRLTEAIEAADRAELVHFQALKNREITRWKLRRYEDAIEDLVAARAAGATGVVTSVRLAALWRRADPESEKPEEIRRELDRTELATEQRAVAYCRAIHHASEWAWLAGTAAAATDRHPKTSELWAYRSIASTMQARREDALRFAREASSLGVRNHQALLAHAQALINVGEPGRALEILARRLEDSPRDPLALQLRAVALQAAGHPDEALESARAARQLDQGNSSALRVLGQILLDRGEYDTAQKHLERAVQLDPDDIAAQNALGIVYKRTKNFDQALEAFERARERAEAVGACEDEAIAQRNRGLVYCDMGEPRKALVAFGDAVATDPGNPKCFYDRGHTYFDLGQLDEAEKDFESALRLDDSYADAWAELGTLRRVREQWKPALEAYDHALAARPDWTLALSNKAATLLELGKTDEALALCERIAEREDTPAESHWNQAVCLKEKGRAPDAVKAYRRYAALVPDDPDPYLECMALLGAMRKFDEALAAVKKAVRVAPDHPVVAFWHAESLVRAERARTGADESDPSAWRTQAFDEALAEYARARDLALRTAPAYWRPGALLLARGESEAALELLVEGCRENPEDYLCHHNRAAALELLGRWKDAIAAYTDAIRLSDRPLPSELSLAEIYVACEDAAARDPKKALLHARRAADLDPDRADVKIWLGAALFRTGEPERAHDALAGAGDPGNDKLRNVRELFLALVEHSLGRGDPASRLESASRWKGGLPSERRMLARLRAEVTAAIDR